MQNTYRQHRVKHVILTVVTITYKVMWRWYLNYVLYIEVSTTTLISEVENIDYKNNILNKSTHIILICLVGCKRTVN